MQVIKIYINIHEYRLHVLSQSNLWSKIIIKLQKLTKKEVGYCKSGYLRWPVVKNAIFIVKQYKWVLTTRMRDLPLKSFDFCTIRAGVFYMFFSLPHN